MSREISLEFINETENKKNHNEQTPDQFFFYLAQPIKEDEQNINNQKNFFFCQQMLPHTMLNF